MVKAAVVLVVLLLQSPRFAEHWCRCWGGSANRRGLPPVAITAMVFVVGFALCTAQFPNFASTRVAADLLTDNAFLGIVATGMTFVIISGGIDLSVGSVIGFTTVFVALAIERLGVPPLVAFVAILLLCAAFGAAMGAIIHIFDMPPFIVTLAGMFLAARRQLSDARRNRRRSLRRSIRQCRISHCGCPGEAGSPPSPSSCSRWSRQPPCCCISPASGPSLCARRQPHHHGPDGHTGRIHDGAHLHAVERPCRPRRHCVLLYTAAGYSLSAVGVELDSHRGCGDRRHVADRRPGVGGRHVARRADSGPDPDLHQFRWNLVELVDQDRNRCSSFRFHRPAAGHAGYRPPRRPP